MKKKPPFWLPKITGLLCYLSLILFTACQSTPSQRLNNICPTCNQFSLITSDQFELKVLHPKDLAKKNAVMHIYIEGDGVPWANGNTPARNPTSKSLLALRLMQQDPAPALYINRPCYGLNQLDNLCASQLWTEARYSDRVLTQLSEALDLIKRKYQVHEFTLIGHSGGGTIAMLLAHGRDDIDGVVTIGANLDHTAWTNYFSYLPLTESLNPAKLPTLSPTVRRTHLIGQKDLQVPAQLTIAAAKLDPNAKVVLEEDYNHFCCWQQGWGQRIKELTAKPTN